MRKALLIALLTCSPALVLAQPTDREAPPPRAPAERPRGGPDRGPEGTPPPLMDRAVLRERLQRRLEENQRATERLQAALEALESGAEPGEVMREAGRDAIDQVRDMRDDRRDDPASGRGFRPWREPPADRPTPEERERTMEFLRERAPAIAARIDRLRETRPEAADAVVARMRPKLREVMVSFERDASLGEARLGEMVAGLDVAEAVRALRAASREGEGSPAAKEAEENLRGAVARGFEARLLVAEREIAALEAQVAHLREEVARRREGMNAEVREKSADLMRRALEDAELAPID